ncbi:MAG: hypothetical protein RMJ96_05450 [Candidatus Bipolaricaulota bacterium]|nr:hypothetical protein [Candidatus Bipolaricaulota bacterium]
MLSRDELVRELSRLEKRIAWLKEQLTPRRGKKRTVMLAGKFPQLSALTDADIDEATHIWEHEFERTLRP